MNQREDICTLGHEKVDRFKYKKKSQKTYFLQIPIDRFESIRIDWSLSNMHGMFPLGERPRADLSLFGLFSTTSNEAINR